MSTETSINKSIPTTLTDLEDLQSLHQTMSVRSVAMFCPDYCTMSPVVYGVTFKCFAFIHQDAVTCKYQVCKTASPTHIMALKGCHLFQRNLTFSRCREESTTCSITSVIDQRRIIQTQKFLLGFDNKEHTNLLVETCRNNKTIMFWCVTAIRINRIQFSESATKRKWIWCVLDGRHTKLSQFPAWQMPVNCSWSGGSSCMPYYLPC